MEHIAAAGQMATDLDRLQAALRAERPAIMQAVAAGETAAFMAGKTGGSLRDLTRHQLGGCSTDDAP
jgi:hypothetical protein